MQFRDKKVPFRLIFQSLVVGAWCLQYGASLRSHGYGRLSGMGRADFGMGQTDTLLKF